MIEELDNTIDFLLEVTAYLHSCLCTKDGGYKPYDIRGVREAVITLLHSEGHYECKDVVEKFKLAFNNGQILLSTFCMGFSEEYEKEMREIHLKNICKFEEKYNIKI